MKEQSKKRTLCKATDNDVKYISLRNGTRFAELTTSCTDAPKIYPDAPNGYMPDGSKLIDVPELYLTSEDYDRIKRETVDAILDTKEDKKSEEPHQMSVMAVPNPNPYIVKKSGLNIMTIPTEDEFLPDAKAIDITPADVHRLNENIKKAVKRKSFGEGIDEISDILEQIGDIQAELICRHQFGNSVRPALENISEEDLCERGFRLFYMLRNKYQGKDAVLREKDK